MNLINVNELDFEKGGGLIPVVVQEQSSRRVLMLAYTDRRALEKTLKSGYAHYWSRTRRALWRKGETSGHVQRVRKILVDCDRDTLLFLVGQTGYACHKMKKSCFHQGLSKTHGLKAMKRPPKS